MIPVSTSPRRTYPQKRSHPRGERLAVPLVILIVCLLSLATAPADAEPFGGLDPAVTSDDTTVAEVEAEVEAATAQGGTLPVMVMLEGPHGGTTPPIGSVSNRARAERVAAELTGDLVPDARPLDDLPIVTATADRRGIEALKQNRNVSRVVPNRARRVSLTQSAARVGAPTAWAGGWTGSGQAVAILDTGVNSAHPFLVGKMIAEGCFSSSTSGSTPICPGPNPTQSTSAGAGAPCTASPSCAHGTHVAGIGVGGAAGSFSGVAPGSQLISVQVFSAGLDSSLCFPDPAPCILAWESDVIRGLNYVYGLRNTFSIAAVNMSLGGAPSTSNCSNEPEMPLITQLRNARIPTVAASGNDGTKYSLSAPACVPGAVSVGATSDTSDTVMSYSNSASSLSLLAPGSTIISSVPPGTSGAFACPAPFAAGTCLGVEGTSMATPHVAGAFALLHQKQPAASVSDNLALLRSTGLPVVDSANGVSTPRIKVDAAVRPPTYHSVSPSRLLDTRDGTGTGWSAPVGQGITVNLQVTGRGGVPSTGASAVVLNVTYVNPSKTSFVTVYPTGVPLPPTSNLNLDPGSTRANLVKSQVGQNGRVSLYNNSGSTHLVADVAGWYDDGGTHDTGTKYHAVNPVRVFDTRDGTGGVPVAKIGAGETLTVDADTLCGFPGVTAVALNITAMNALLATHVTAWPADQAPPLASNLNLFPGQTVPNLSIMKVGPGGSVSFKNNSGSIDLLADLLGCYDDGSATNGRFVPAAPSRLLDTRSAIGTPGTSPVGPAATLNLKVTGVGPIPSSGVLAVVLTVTATQPTSFTHITVWPSGSARPLASNLNLSPGQTVPNMVVVPVGASGEVSLFNNAGTTHLLADVSGWFTA